MKKSSKQFLVMFLVMFAAGFLISGFVFGADSKDTAATAVGIMRRINTAEAEAAHQDHYIPLTALPPGEVPHSFGYDVRLIVSSDGHHYMALVQDKANLKVTFYSDERGVIYPATPLE